jgi:uncharacterized phage infection (PIP) family protein YhgE
VSFLELPENPNSDLVIRYENKRPVSWAFVDREEASKGLNEEKK